MNNDNEINLYTIQMGQWRIARDRDIHFVDITAKSGVQQFAPDYSLVMSYKERKISNDFYAELYHEKMMLSQREHPRYWDTFRFYKNVAVACYCPADTFCHRLLFVKLLTEYLARQNIKVNYLGELKK